LIRFSGQKFKIFKSGTVLLLVVVSSIAFAQQGQETRVDKTPIKKQNQMMVKAQISRNIHMEWIRQKGG